MFIPKKYGQAKVQDCPFCGKTAIAMNVQGIPVCKIHKKNKLPDLLCVCGEYLDLKDGKYGPYFTCMNCGNINFKKGLDMNPKIVAEKQIKEPRKELPRHIHSYKKEEKKDIVVTSDEVDFL